MYLIKGKIIYTTYNFKHLGLEYLSPSSRRKQKKVRKMINHFSFSQSTKRKYCNREVFLL